MAAEIVIHGITIDKGDYVRWNVQLGRRFSVERTWLVAAFCIALGVTILAPLYIAPTRTPELGRAVAIVGGILIGVGASVAFELINSRTRRRAMWQGWSEDPRLERYFQPYSVAATEEVFSVHYADDVRASYPWASFANITLERDTLLLFPSPNTFIWVPRSAVKSEDDWKQLCSWAKLAT